MIYNIGSINIDHVFSVPHMPAPGETLSASSYQLFLGGKGINQSIAVAKSGAAVRHVGAVGTDGSWVLDQIADFGVDTSHIARLTSCSTGLGMIYVDSQAENMIVIHGGANQRISEAQVAKELEAHQQQGAWLLLQNETNITLQAAQIARKLGYRIAYASAPFIPELTLEMLPLVDLITVNQTEAQQLEQHLGHPLDQLRELRILLTMGSKGAAYLHKGERISQAAFKVQPVDTTGAGDTFFGAFMACYVGAALQNAREQAHSGDELATIKAALRYAAGAAALQVSKQGAAIAIPERAQVLAFLQNQD